MTGQEYRPIAYHRRTGGNPVFIAGGFSLIAQNSGLTSKIVIVDLVFRVSVRSHGATANVAHAHRNSNGIVPDEWI